MSKYSTSTDDVEAQSAVPVPLPSAVAVASSAPAAASGYDDEAGKGIGMAMFFCIVLGSVLALGWIPLLGAVIGASICLIAAIVLASTITCGCCGGSKLNLNPKVKRWSTATLSCLVGILILIAYYTFFIVAGAFIEGENNVYVGADVVMALKVVFGVLFFLAAVYAGIFTWGRKSCGNA